MKQRFLHILFLAMLASLLSACADDQAVVLGPQHWKNVNFRVETRPSPLRVGMNEFIVIANLDGGKLGVDLVIQMRVGEHGNWRQAIQDGFSGVYRRAVRVDDPKTQSLSMHIQSTKNDDETVLHFPLNQKP